ncbi:succinyl-diaminopimelate desuccinylase [Candidatus Erwinia haradaeae]|uniref:Succinyl-diaminopimelate desuccinylase n=1 Tax=Candidatus Erwinia haradaeae TaxID=1922217 RepID=A0A451D293_9GAMM|nr:succinyl-diaminopimelate desuccinylase [Candidatus Erwinia haradaeae]VFP79752.1 Succinyl-diaminopimelate desuccinylase [Candidatus Erwinia haradaeae]
MTFDCPIISLTQQLICCPSISPYDFGCQDILIARLQAIGFTIEKMKIHDTLNFWAWRGYGDTLVFAGHTDVVPTGDHKLWAYPPFQLTMKNGILFGRGVSDMKGALASMIIAAERFVNRYSYHKGRLAFLITSDEEGSGIHGTEKVIKKLMERNENLKYCLIGEPTSTKIIGDVIKNGRRGSMTAHLNIHGIQGHIAYPHHTENPIHKAIPVLHELISTKWDKTDSLFQPTYMQIYNIQSGTGVSNITPCDCCIEFNFRFNNQLTEIMIKNQVQEILNKHHLQYTIVWKLSRQPFFTPQCYFIEKVASAVEFYTNQSPKILTTGGTSDGCFFRKIGAQVVELGLMDTTIHQINECAKISDLQLLSKIYQRIIENMII